jgi:hypothetical protein
MDAARYTIFQSENLVENLGLGARMILNWIIKKLAVTMLTGFAWLRNRPEVDFCVHGDEPLGPINGGEFVKKPSR